MSCQSPAAGGEEPSANTHTHIHNGEMYVCVAVNRPPEVVRNRPRASTPKCQHMIIKHFLVLIAISPQASKVSQHQLLNTTPPFLTKGIYAAANSSASCETVGNGSDLRCWVLDLVMNVWGTHSGCTGDVTIVSQRGSATTGIPKFRVRTRSVPTCCT